ncbi:MAG: ComEC/Rec2 family competence protein [Rhizobiaceae bacterium]
MTDDKRAATAAGTAAAADASHAPVEVAESPGSDNPPISPQLNQPSRLRRLKYLWQFRTSRIGHWFARQLSHERSQRGGFLWVPVFLGVGCACYFALPREPWPYAFPVLALLLSILVWRARQSTAMPLLLALMILVAGISLAQWHTASRATRMVSESMITTITGRIVRAEPRPAGRNRYTLAVETIGGLDNPPEMVRLTARQSQQSLGYGDVIAGRARLAPPPGPALPGGYDFRFFSWYSGIGGSGFFLGNPVLVEPVRANNLSIRGFIALTRQHIAHLLDQALPPRSAALATALIIGERSRIDEATNEALRKSGLAHILAISGLHMALVTMTVIGAVRFVLATMPNLALRHPTKKIAGCCGLVSATIYLVLSGANLSTQRAYIMVVVMLLAVLMDRRALTMRNVAIAALIVLLLAPHAVLQPGFQMSFAAAAALVGTFEWSSQRERRRRGSSVPIGIWPRSLQSLRRSLTGLLLVPVIAGLATGLFAAFHFYRIAPLGLIANVLAMPIVSLAVMPLALVSVILMPFGLEQVTLIPFGHGLSAVVAIAAWVAELGPTGGTGQISRSALIIGSLALLIATLARSQLKLMAVPFILLAGATGYQRPVPDFIVAENGRQVGALSGGHLVLSKPRSEKFTTRIWKQAYRVDEEAGSEKQAGDTSAMVRRCDASACVLHGAGMSLAHIFSTARLSQHCLHADILVIPYAVPWACSFLPKGQRPVIIDSGHLKRHGAHAIFSSPAADTGPITDRIRIQTAITTDSRFWNN